MSDDWMDELRAVGGSLLPTAAAREQVIEGVRRRARRRTIALGAGTTGTVAAVVAAVVLLPAVIVPGGDSPTPAPAPATSAPAPSPRPSAPPTPWHLQGWWEEPAPGDCPELSKIFDPEAVPPVPNLAQQQRVVTELNDTAFKTFGVHYSVPTALGVVALATGDVAVAKRVLREDYGVELVYEWDRNRPDVGLDVDAQVAQILDWQIGPVGRRLDREVRNLEGYAEIAMWGSAGGVLLSWKAPVPAEIAALAGTRPNGVRVFVEGVPYSEKELFAAAQRVREAASSGRVDAEISHSTYCGDQSGLRVGVLPEAAGDRKADLERRFEEIAGMPVTVVPGEVWYDL